MTFKDVEPIGYYNGAHGFLYDELDKDCYCQGGCSMQAVYTREQVVSLLKKFGAEINDSAGQNDWGWSPVRDGMIERFINDSI